MFGTGEQDLQLPAQIWVLLTYQNAFVDDAGKLQMRRDVYNIDSRTLAAIKSERGMIGCGYRGGGVRVDPSLMSSASAVFVVVSNRGERRSLSPAWSAALAPV